MRTLTLDQIGQSCPLVEAVLPGISRDEWTEYAGNLITSGLQSAGIIAVFNEQRYIYALACYRAELELRHHRVLNVDQFITVSIVDCPSVRRALTEATEEVARNLDCSAIHIFLASNDRTLSTSPSVDDLVRNGFTMESVDYVKVVRLR